MCISHSIVIACVSENNFVILGLGKYFKKMLIHIQFSCKL